MKYAEQDLVRLKRDPASVGVVVSISPGNGNMGIVSGNHYQIYWSAGTERGAHLDETWHTEEELTKAITEVIPL